MFTSFEVHGSEAQPPPAPAQQKHGPARPKRAQVSRACDWCRLARTKCDSHRPCRPCKQAGRECKSGGLEEFRGVATATREVHKLRSRIQELEAQLLTAEDRGQAKTEPPRTKILWRGVRVDEVQYGPSSLQYFVHRLETFTGMDLMSRVDPVAHSMPKIDLDNICGTRMRRTQQDYFLDLFWQGYHAIYPVIDEAEFRQHYDSLWEGETTRKCSPLALIVLALCIQSYKASNGSPSDESGTESSLGDEYYQGVHRAITRFADKAPSLTTVQCCFLSAIYLLGKGHANSAAVLLGTAVQSATAIGIHNEAPGGSRQHQTRARLWSCLRTLDLQLSMHLGRPPLTLHIGHGAHPPSDDASARLLGPSYAVPEPGLNWLSFHRHHRELVELAHRLHVRFYALCEDMLQDMDDGDEDGPDFYRHPSLREKCATVFGHDMESLKAWAEELPAGLKTPRRSGTPFSTNRTPLDLSQGGPLWLQRQRIILELEYHMAYIVLFRPFICFLPTPALGTLTSDNHCIECLDHAIAMTNMLHQLLAETDVIKGWFQLADWQTNATFLAGGFACAYPICPPTPSARRVLEPSGAVFGLLGARDMAALARQLGDQAEAILNTFRVGLGLPSTPPSTAPSLDNGDRESGTASTAPPPAEDAPPVNLDPGPWAVPDDADFWAFGDPAQSQLWGDFLKDLDPALLDWNRG